MFINFLITMSFTFSILYFIIIAIEEMGVLKHYMYDSEIKSEWGLLLLGADTICKIIIYLIIAYFIAWIYLNYDVYISSIVGGSLI